MAAGSCYIGPMFGYHHTEGPYNISYEAHKSHKIDGLGGPSELVDPKLFAQDPIQQAMRKVTKAPIIK